MPAPATGARPAPRPAQAGPASPGGGLREALLARLRPVPVGEGVDAPWVAEVAALEAASGCRVLAGAGRAGPPPDPLAGPPDGEDAWLAELPGPLLDEYIAATAEPARPEPLAAGLWSRAGGDGAGFAAGGVGDRLAPGPVLAGLVDDLCAVGLGTLSDDELVGVLRAGRRLASWSASIELAAAGDLMRRRLEQDAAQQGGSAEHADAEVAAALTLTGRAAGRLLDLAMILQRLPRTAQALAAGVIDVPRAMAIADEVAGLADEHLAAVEERVLARAADQTATQVRAAVRRAVIAADASAARRRRERAGREARVERWAEQAGTAALAGRDLPPAGTLAADQHLTGLAQALRAAGVAGTMDQLRARVFVALLTGQPVTSLLPPGTIAAGAPGGPCVSGELSGAAEPGDHGGPAGRGRPGGPGGRGAGGCGGEVSPGGAAAGSANGPAAAGAPGWAAGPGSAGAGSAGYPSNGGASAGLGSPGGPGLAGAPGASGGAGTPGGGSAGLAGMVNLTMPLGTWLGLVEAPGEVPGFGPLGPGDCRSVGQVMAADPRTRWCLTLTDDTGRPVAHGCVPRRRGPPPTGTGPPPTGTSPPPTGTSPPPTGTGPPPSRSNPRPPAGNTGNTGPPATAGPRHHAGAYSGGTGGIAAWVAGVPVAWLEAGQCAHRRQSAGYRPPPGLQHLVRVRQQLCVFPGCGRAARRCDVDHTVAYHRGGRTCECNLAPLCRKHHQAKQAQGWALEQPQPGIMIWTTPSGRRYTTRLSVYPQ